MQTRSTGSLAHVLQSISENTVGGVPVLGARSSAGPRIIQEWAASKPGVTVVICRDSERADYWLRSLQALRSLQPHVSVLEFPTWEHSPFGSISPSIRTRLARIRTLHVLNQLRAEASPSPTIIITVLAAACQATLPVEILSNKSRYLRTGDSIESREALIAALFASGYLRTDSVEDRGTFAQRGEILDVFPPHLENPVRVELYDTLIERMRYFDPDTQRSLPESALDSVHIGPAREVLLCEETEPLLRENLKTTSDDRGIPRAQRDPILAALSLRAYPEWMDVWAPFAYENPLQLLDHLPAGATIAWEDSPGCRQTLEELLEKEREEFSLTKNLVPSVDTLFRWDESVHMRLMQQTRVRFESIVLADEDDRALRLQIDPIEIVSFDRSAENLQHWLSEKNQVTLFCSTSSQRERLSFLLEQRKLHPTLVSGSLPQGFSWPAEGVVYLSDSEALGERARTRRSNVPQRTSAEEWSGLQSLSDLSPGDLIVHRDHGIGRYVGLSRLELGSAASDFLVLEYAQNDKLYLPIYRLNVVQKYFGSEDSTALDKLGGTRFAKAKEQARESAKRLAVDLVQLYAERTVRKGFAFSGRDSLFHEFEARFPFEETPDQKRAIDETLRDMERGKIMDRLVCGDVGFGKTEVALRAAFRAVSDGKQVAVLVPTTVLALQHESSFRNRFRDYPFVIESISRFKGPKAIKEVLARVSEGKVDVLIGTHRVLSKDVRFKDLGLIVVDEEHRFGVDQKEKLKAYKTTTPVLTLTATPIPRTLHMALAGLREISLINTAPVDRVPVRTYVSRYDEDLIRRAIRFELSRGGQVFFLHNRVQTIYEVARKLQEWIPEATVSVGHGQMPDAQLEKTMVDFYEKRSQILVCTAIIESGLDIPSANTILIDRADMLGLAQLYQLRGRVGRGQERGYAYLLIPSEETLTADAKARLEAMQRFVELGSGFNVASRDLEIRGGGDFLGPNQSGHITAVGFELYTELLDSAVRELQGKPPETEPVSEPEIKVPFSAYLSEAYVPDIHQRLALYRQLSAARTEADVHTLENELGDRFGAPPHEAMNLLWLIRIKLLLRGAGVDTLVVGPEKISLSPGARSRLDPTRMIALLSTRRNEFTLTPESKVVWTRAFTKIQDLCMGLEQLLEQLVAPS